MAFLYPGFLFALFALAVPVIIHLFNFRKFKKIYFSNVQFLKDVQKQQSSRSNLKNRLILAFRMFALAFLVLAFARPFLPSGDTAKAGKQNTVSVFVDNSYSMETLNREGTLLDEAKRRAKEIAAAYSVNDRFQLLTQDFEGKNQRFLNREEFDQAVDEVKISAQSRNLQQIISRQQNLLQTLPDASPKLYLISDFQKNLDKSSISVSAKVPVNLIEITAQELANIAVDSVWMLSPLHQPNTPEKLVFRLHNFGNDKAEKIPLKLIINGITKALGSYNVAAQSVRQDTLAFSGLSAGWQSAEISLNDNSVTFDNHFYFTFEVSRQMHILQIADQQPNLFISAVFNSDTFFKADFAESGNVNYAALALYPVIYLSDVKEVSAGLAQQLQAYVKQGGSLVVFPSGEANLASYKTLLQGLNADYPIALTQQKTKVTGINLSAQIFKDVFEKMPERPDLPVVEQYFTLTAKPETTRFNLLEMPGRQPFLSSYTSGRGKVFLFSVAAAVNFSNLPYHALFVPLLLRMAFISGQSLPLFYTLGSNENPEIRQIKQQETALTLKNGQQSFIPDARSVNGKTELFVADQVKQAAIYHLMQKDSLIAAIAFNNDPAESSLQYFSGSQLKSIFANVKEVNLLPATKASIAKQIAETNSGTQLWKLCLILALLCLAAEVLLIRYYKVSQPVKATVV